MKSTDLADIAAQNISEKMKLWFLRFAEQTNGSKMYEYLSAKIADDEEIMALASQGNHAQPIPNLLLASVNYLLYQKPGAELKNFYPNHDGQFQSGPEFLNAFHDFCVSHADEIIPVLKNRSVQTNEVRRCAVLLPAYSMISKASGGNALTVIDVGTSGGLNLLFDQFSYDYGAVKIPNDRSSLSLTCEIEGSLQPLIEIPVVSERFGIDINPIDLANEDEALWALSLVKPIQKMKFM